MKAREGEGEGKGESGSGEAEEGRVYEGAEWDPSSPSLTSNLKIQDTTYTRISRILHLFQLHQTPHLILGSLGAGDFQNPIDLVATIFADLLRQTGWEVFETVVFTILGKEFLRTFSRE